MKRILVATDFSQRADAAVRRAGLLAREHGAEVVVCHVVDDDQPEPLREADSRKATAALNKLVQTTRELQGVACSVLVVLGDPFDGIVRAARSSAAELVVLGPHRKGLLRGIFVGTTAERVMRHGTLPVLMVNRQPARPYGRVLAAVDLSDWSAHAVGTARRLGLVDGAELTVFYAFDALSTRLVSAGVPEETLRQNVAEAAAAATRELDEFVRKLDLSGVNVSTAAREGSPARAIIAAAEELQANLVVIGTRGRTGLAKLLLGSVAEELVRELDRDVLAVATAGKR